MNYFDFLGSHAKVETIIGLIAFIVAAILGYLAHKSSVKMKHIGEIISKADTQTKADLAVALTGVLPSYRIPELTKQQGFEVIKLQLVTRGDEFKLRVRVLRLSIVLLFVLIIFLAGKSYLDFSRTTGKQSPIINGDKNYIKYDNGSGSVKDSLP